MGKKSHARYRELPLIYSCSGVSNVAQLANAVAVSLDRAGTAEMTCIARGGGAVKSLVSTAKSGRHYITLEGSQYQLISDESEI